MVEIVADMQELATRQGKIAGLLLSASLVMNANDMQKLVAQWYWWRSRKRINIVQTAEPK